MNAKKRKIKRRNLTGGSWIGNRKLREFYETRRLEHELDKELPPIKTSNKLVKETRKFDRKKFKRSAKAVRKILKNQ